MATSLLSGGQSASFQVTALVFLVKETKGGGYGSCVGHTFNIPE